MALKDEYLKAKQIYPAKVKKMEALQRNGLTMREISRRMRTNINHVQNILYYWKHGEKR